MHGDCCTHHSIPALAHVLDNPHAEQIVKVRAPALGCGDACTGESSVGTTLVLLCVVRWGDVVMWQLSGDASWLRPHDVTPHAPGGRPRRGRARGRVSHSKKTILVQGTNLKLQP